MAKIPVHKMHTLNCILLIEIKKLCKFTNMAVDSPNSSVKLFLAVFRSRNEAILKMQRAECLLKSAFHNFKNLYPDFFF